MSSTWFCCHTFTTTPQSPKKEKITSKWEIGEILCQSASIFVPLNANIPGIPTVVNVITTRLVPNFSSPLGAPPYPPNSRLLWNEPRPKTKRGKNGFHDYPIALPGSCFLRKATKTHTTKQSILKYTFAWCMLFCWLWYKSKTGNCVYFSKQDLN